MLAVATMILVPAGTLRADDPNPSEGTRFQIGDEPAEFTNWQDAESVDEAIDRNFSDSYNNPYIQIEDVPDSPRLAGRFGWWGLEVDGSRSNVGEWQGLDNSGPFWDVDGLTSDGYRTIDFFATGTENESTQGGLFYYGGPGLSVDLDYDRFIHRLGHDPLGGLPIAGGFPPQGGFFDPVLADGGGGTTEQPGYPMFGEDFNVGQDYAIRVQQLKANFKGNLTENIKWRLNVWGLKKEGTRGANSTQHCFTATHAPSGDNVSTCHVVSKGQQINWLTMEVEPVIEARFGSVTLEYSRTMRKFEQNDQLVTNDFSRNPSYGFGPGAENGAYGYVPENFTEIDRLKIGAQLTTNTDMYVVGHSGNTHNEFRQSDRRFYGVDARLTNTSIDGLALTAYGKTFSQNNSADTVALNTRYPGQASTWLEATPPQTIYSPDSLYLGLADRDVWEVGVKGRWTPRYSGGWCDGGALTAGYEYGEINRTNVTYDLEALTPPVLFTQPTTLRHEAFVGVDKNWSRRVNTYVRYRVIQNRWPLTGVTHREQLSLDAALNSNLPEHEDRVEIGGSWTPADNFMLNASFWIRSSYNHSEFVDFDEDDYPLVVSAWYAADDQWSFTAGYASFSNWIDQDVTLGREDGGISRGSQELTAWTDTWSYSGRADVVTLGASYAASRDLNLTGGFEYVRGRNRISNIPSNTYSELTIPLRTITYEDIPGYSQVNVNTYRIMGGFDYALSDRCGFFGRYNYYDYDDQAMAYNAGTAHMFLAGVNGVY